MDIRFDLGIAQKKKWQNYLNRLKNNKIRTHNKASKIIAVYYYYQGL